MKSSKNHFAAIKGLNIPIPYAQAGIIFTPSSILNIGLGTTAGTYWPIGDVHGIGLYNPANEKYEHGYMFPEKKFRLIGLTSA